MSDTPQVLLAFNLAAIEQGFTEDAVARFADFPEMRGREAIMRFLRARFARTQGYRLKKTLQDLIEVGTDLLAVKEVLAHGQFLPVLGHGGEVGGQLLLQGQCRAVGCLRLGPLAEIVE